ncbi:GNAT family N-acetyltransferase [Actinoplanes bogorensis]|uniref:GNAT family N-acetyltransferase n=1 Tax=Paractinoplanes bogorensis TaxID=1610840 RepID=A0ABS5YQX4_9ACTN|nr:N-acetyltransferase [Actinoplanes bogorensis]MBU2665768.1 GNAT family N-acetyltransferase [Actinoplanes bogorensis]
MTSTLPTGFSWIDLTGLPSELLALAERCFAADGGMPLATDRAFLARRWSGEGVTAFGLRAGDGRLVAAGAARGGPAFTGLIDPEARGQGLGAEVLDRGLALAGTTVETESLTGDAEALFTSRGLVQSFAEDVMHVDLERVALPPVDWPQGATVSTWDELTAQRFHTTYHASFRDRPGFPADPADEWIAENEEDDDFVPEQSLLVTLPDLGDAGFVTAARGWIVQVGVVPFARRRGLAGALITESLTRMAADDADHAWLTVNVNNPGAAALYRRLGFTHQGRRARYQAATN